MPSLRNAIAVVLLFSVMCAGCTNRDRELANRTGDGSDTFKYKAPDAPPPAEAPSVGLKPTQTKPKNKDNVSEAFHYKRDSRGFPSTPKAAEK